MRISALFVSVIFLRFTSGFAQKPVPAPVTTVPTAKTVSVDKQKFALLNNGATLGMIIQSALKADTKRLSLTEAQVPKARTVITEAVVKFNDGVKALKKAGMSQQKLRALAVGVENGKVRAYQPILSPAQYTVLIAQHRKMYPEAKL